MIPRERGCSLSFLPSAMLFMTVWASSAACSGSASNGSSLGPPEPVPAAPTTPDGSTSQDGADGGPVPPDDAAAPREAPRLGVRYHYSYASDGPFKTTASACAKSGYWGDRCGTCASGPASPGVAAAYVGEIPDKLASCDAVPTSSQGSVKTVAYCCETPFITVDGTSPPKPCDAVCAAQSLICAPKAPQYDGFGGGLTPGSALVRYTNGSTSTNYVSSSCASVPAMTTTVKGATLSFDRQECACADARSVLPSPP